MSHPSDVQNRGESCVFHVEPVSEEVLVALPTERIFKHSPGWSPSLEAVVHPPMRYEHPNRTVPVEAVVTKPEHQPAAFMIVVML
jgi:hypothetical protein